MAIMINTHSHSLGLRDGFEEFQVAASRQRGSVTKFHSSRLLALNSNCGGARQPSTRTTSHQCERQATGRTAKTFRHLSAPRFQAPTLHTLLVVLIILISSCSTSAAVTPRPAPTVVDYPERITDPTILAPEKQRSAFDPSGPLLLDLRPPPPGVAWHYNSYGEVLDGPEDPYLDEDEDSYLKKRQILDDTTSSSTTKSHSTSTTRASTKTSATQKATSTAADSSSTLASTTTSGDLATATGDSSTPLPSPFDSSLGNNFTTAACPAFIQSFLAEPQFKACLPFSLLLQNSNSFFQAEKSIVRITQVLDATCAASSSTCAPYLSSLAANLTSSANCQADYQAQNPTVIQARIGLLSYLPLYSASCLKNQQTQAYCFADAITNASSTTDSYIYFLPLNMTLPASSQPTCNKCLQQTMSVFNAAAANRTQSIANTYNSAAQQINVQCGPGFVTSTIPIAISGANNVHGLMNLNAAVVAMMMCVLAWLL